MDSGKLNNWLTLLANFGVVIGLALLIYELQQTQHIVETQAAVERQDQMQEAMVSFAVSESLALIVAKANSDGVEALSEDEFLRLQNWEWSVRHRMRGQYIQYLRGYLDKATADRIVQAAAARLPMWDDLEIPLFDDDFGRAVNRAAGR
jgi:hypothetical protein